MLQNVPLLLAGVAGLLIVLALLFPNRAAVLVTVGQLLLVLAVALLASGRP